MTYINYDTTKYPFKEIISNILNVDNLEKIHNIENYDLFTKGTDQSTIWHKLYYNNSEYMINTISNKLL